jgi:hypothetical protein
LRDPSIAALTLGSFLVFAAVALYADRATMHLSRKTRTRPPHKSLLRGWFALLAVGCLWILLEPVLLRHR